MQDCAQFNKFITTITIIHDKILGHGHCTVVSDAERSTHNYHTAHAAWAHFFKIVTG